MKEYIDKSAVKAEIEKRYDEYTSSILKHYDAYKEAKAQELGKILTILNTLEVKEVDLEKEIKNGIDSLSNLYCYMEDLFNGNEEEGVYPIPKKVKNELFEFAKYFFELGLKAQKGE